MPCRSGKHIDAELNPPPERLKRETKEFIEELQNDMHTKDLTAGFGPVSGIIVHARYAACWNLFLGPTLRPGVH